MQGVGNFGDISQWMNVLYIPTLLIPEANKLATMVALIDPEEHFMSAANPSR